MRARQAAVAFFATFLLSASATAGEQPFDPESSAHRYFQRCVMALYESDLQQIVKQDPTVETYRLLFLPSFRDQTSMRVIAWSDGTGRMILHRLDNSSCEKNRSDVEERIYPLSRDEVTSIKAAVADYDFWKAAFRWDDRVTCSDGVAAFFEGVKEGKYNLVHRRCTWNRKFQNLVELFHRLARTKEPYSALILE